MSNTEHDICNMFANIYIYIFDICPFIILLLLFLLLLLLIYVRAISTCFGIVNKIMYSVL